MHNFTPMMFSLLVIIGLQVSVQAGERRPERSVNRSYKHEMTVTNGKAWGKWGQREMCPSGTYAAGFSLKVESPLYGKQYDNTALNGIRLHCVSVLYGNIGYHHDYSSVRSDVGSWGQWTDITWCPTGFLIDFKLQVEPYQANGDNTAANNIKFQCSDSEYSIFTGDGTHWGDWGSWSQMCINKGICGIKTRVEEPQGGGDDTALNDVRMYCCN